MKLLVYLHAAVKQRAFQSLLQSSLPGISTTAVGRIADFDRSLAEGQDAVLTLPIVLSSQGMKPSLQGLRGGAAEETYALVSSGAPPDPKTAAAIGALDLLGRDGTTNFVRRLTGGQARVERVTKVEDLLPLLQMQRVDAVLTPVRLVSELQATSRLPLTLRELPTKVGLPAAANVGSAAAQVIAAISKLPPAACKMLGVDSWR